MGLNQCSSIVNCFTEEMMSRAPKINSNGSLNIGTDFIGLSEGKITDAFWNKKDGTLVVKSDTGVTYHYVGLQRRFESYQNDNGKPHDMLAYQKAVEENTKYRKSLIDEKKARIARKKSKKDKKSKCGFCSVLKCVFKIFWGWLCLGILLDETDK